MEMLVVIGLITIIGSISMFIDINSYRGNALRAEVNSLGTTLQTARADSLNNMHERRHGVAIAPGGINYYVIFEGDTYATRDPSRDENIKISYDVLFSPSSPSEIVFDQLSGDSSDWNITMTDQERNMDEVIGINHEGKISW